MSAPIESPPLPASLQMANDVERRLRQQQPGIYFVLPRVVRRVLQNELDIASPLQQPPHRKTYVIQRDRLLWLVNRDELGVSDRAALPEQIILIAQPEEDQLEKMTREELLRHYWRLVFHARIDSEMLKNASRGRMTASELRSRIDQLGQTAFDEIRSVLRAEQMLTKPDDDRNVYSEFVAVYHELTAFASRLIPLYFPSLPPADQVLKVINRECDATRLLDETRPLDLARDIPADVEINYALTTEVKKEPVPSKVPRRSARHYESLIRKAARISAKGNHVRASLTLQSALEVAPETSIDDARNLLRSEVQKLVNRLQAALEFSDEEALPWIAICEKLLPAAQTGFWNPNARLLYDLQSVCIDSEQEIYRVDLLRWAFSLGKSPLKRPLPMQRIVMMSKHLRRAALRVPNIDIDPEGQTELSHLIHEAADAAEQILRSRVGPTIERNLEDAGFVPASIVERVALKKMVQELSDGIVERGFITLGGLRDTISRNQLKMPDLVDVKEFFKGDPLLRADKLMSVSLAGVYQRGPFYLRFLQKLNSLAYGIHWGRLLTQYIALPFGLSFLLLMSIEEIGHLILGFGPAPQHVAAELHPHDELRHEGEAPVEAQQAEDQPEVLPPVADATVADEPVPHSELVAEEPPPTLDEADETAIPPAVLQQHAAGHGRHLVYSHEAMLILGCVIFMLIHFPRFRQWVIWFLVKSWAVLKVLLVEVPRAVLRWPWVDWLMKSFPMMLFRRFALAPLIATFFFWQVLPHLGFYSLLNRWWGLAIFIASFVVLNSRVGRDTEELAREFFGRTWYRIRVHLVMGMFTLIVDVFRALTDWIERILYAVDEWLRFRSGESHLTLGAKAIFGLIWSFIHGVVRFCVTLLIEPQLNPIKHFPVVTVSHKILFATFYLPLGQSLVRLFDLRVATAYTASTLILMCIPGVFGFLAWELKENWRLYKANRSPKLRPVRIGDHGETLLRLLCPGFHSGTIPKLFAKQRRAARRDVDTFSWNNQARFAERLHHEAAALRHFIERELVALLDISRTFRDDRFQVRDVELATNRVVIWIDKSSKETAFPADTPLQLEFAEQSGWLVATVREPGWLSQLPARDVEVFKVAVMGLYKLAAVDLVREQIEIQLAQSTQPGSKSVASNGVPADRKRHAYDINSTGLVVWPHRNYEHEVHYVLDDQPVAHPRPRSAARAAGLTAFPMGALMFNLHDIDWEDWRKFWDHEQSESPPPSTLLSFNW
ncbi:hypothetical protein [Schlesneria sp.]|uniref:hypothetical protein n=1 Tax=Schlesneria sp. TaxID=2762018 RepID=UPI002F0961F2